MTLIIGICTVYVGDNKVSNTFLSSQIDKADFSYSGSIDESNKTMQVFLSSPSFFIKTITTIAIQAENESPIEVSNSSFTYLSSKALQFSISASPGYTYNIIEIVSDNSFISTEYYLITKNCSLIDPTTPYLYNDHCLPSCENLVTYHKNCYENCDTAGKVHNLELLTENGYCVEECSIRFGKENEISKNCINCVDNGKRVVEGV